ncbi:MAG: hypothetical protein LH654_01530, partial [Thermoleophilia bacterium]|nr:hypothetical protein [Thermoleophilia bacterium]
MGLGCLRLGCLHLGRSHAFALRSFGVLFEFLLFLRRQRHSFALDLRQLGLARFGLAHRQLRVLLPFVLSVGVHRVWLRRSERL